MSTTEDRQQAVEAFERAIAQYDSLSQGDPSDLDYRRQLSLALKNVGSLLQLDKKPQAALERYQRALEMDEVRVSRSPQSASAKLDLSFSLASVGNVLAGLGDIPASLDHYQRARALREELVRADPADMFAARSLARAHLSIGRVLEEAHRPDQAIREDEMGLAVMKNHPAAAAIDGVMVAQIQSGLGDAHGQLGFATQQPRAARILHLREAARWYVAAEQSYRALTNRGPLPPSEAARSTRIESELRRCRQELARFGVT